MATNRVTLADVARAAGVSQTTASFVLSGRRAEMRISAEVETRVLQAARTAGYRPNIVSRSLRTGTSHTIGFISDAVATTPFAGQLIQGALDAARDRGHLLFIGETEGDPDLERELIDAMHDRGVDGIVLASMYTRKIAVPKAVTAGPAVLLNAVPANRSRIPSVVPDEVQAGRAVVRVLLAAGHRESIGLIGAAPPSFVPKGSLLASSASRASWRHSTRPAPTSAARRGAPTGSRRSATTQPVGCSRRCGRRRSSASTTGLHSAPTRRLPTSGSASRPTSRSCRLTMT